MSQTLYRKYRPQTFADVAEQNHVVRTLVNQLANGTVAHAYLFAGPRGIGKTTIARLLAKAVSCEGRKAGESEPCNVCSACLDMNAGRLLDVMEIDAASQTGVADVRDGIIENARFAPTRGKMKVFIIDEAHMLTTYSFNALLKTLEEPPPYVMFILATTELHKIPATIVSRCQRFDFHRIPAPVMIERLLRLATSEGKTVVPSVLATIARLSEGCLRDAESLLGQVFALGEDNVTEDVASIVLPETNMATVAALGDAVTKRDATRAVSVLAEFVENGGSVAFLTDEFLEYARTMLVVRLGGPMSERYDEGSAATLREYCARLSPRELGSLVDLLLSARLRTAPSAFPHLPLEIAIVEFCTSDDGGQREPPKDPPPSAPSAVSSPLPKEPQYDFGAGDVPQRPVLAQISTTEKGDVLVSLDEIAEKWQRCCAVLGETNVALPLILQSGKPVAVSGDYIHIGCAYAFHVDALREPKNKRLVEDAIGAVLQRSVRIESVLIKKDAENDSVNGLLAAFGGTVV